MSIARAGPPPRRREAEKGKEIELKDENMLIPRKLNEISNMACIADGSLKGNDTHAVSCGP